MRERRKFLRAHLSIIIRYRDKNNNETEAFTGTIGGGGLFIETYSPLPVNEQIYMEFYLPETERKMSLMGQVVWIRDRYIGEYPPGMGIQFLNISKRDQVYLDEIITKVLKGEH